ncbi:MAG: bacteriocin fulvocin C-related protein [Gemmatimonadaceae bacterium]|nr:bacteriocin fulvocin C-related protein [Gemmatimonadaceae bacterium]
MRYWNERLGEFTGARSSLNGRQRRFVDSVRATMPRFFDTVPPNSQQVAQLFARAAEVLSRPVALDVFVSLDLPDARTTGNRRGSLRRTVAAARGRAAVRGSGAAVAYLATQWLPRRALAVGVSRTALLQNDCGCSLTGGDFCGLTTGISQCQSTGCVVYPIGCGILGWASCNGECSKPDI